MWIFFCLCLHWVTYFILANKSINITDVFKSYSHWSLSQQHSSRDVQTLFCHGPFFEGSSKSVASQGNISMGWLLVSSRVKGLNGIETTIANSSESSFPVYLKPTRMALNQVSVPNHWKWHWWQNRLNMKPVTHVQHPNKDKPTTNKKQQCSNIKFPISCCSLTQLLVAQMSEHWAIHLTSL